MQEGAILRPGDCPTDLARGPPAGAARAPLLGGGHNAFKFEARNSGGLYVQVTVCGDAGVGGPAFDAAGRPGVTLGARADGYAGGPALVAGRSCDIPGAYDGEQSRSQALCQRQLDSGRRRQEETLWSAGGPTWSRAGTKLPGSGCTQGPGFGRQVQSGRQAQTEDG